MKHVVFERIHQGYQPGEVAHFLDGEAAHLVERGLASYYEAEGLPQTPDPVAAVRPMPGSGPGTMADPNTPAGAVTLLPAAEGIITPSIGAEPPAIVAPGSLGEAALAPPQQVSGSDGGTAPVAAPGDVPNDNSEPRQNTILDKVAADNEALATKAKAEKPAT